MRKLKRLSQNGFQECFQHFYSRCQKCRVVQGGYFEGNVALMTVDTEKFVKHNKGDLLLHKATSFDPTVGSSSGD
jgi:hypothetical protein